jgi:hypothetical protein
MKVAKINYAYYQCLRVRIVIELGECSLVEYQDRLHVVDTADLTPSLSFTQAA